MAHRAPEGEVAEDQAGERLGAADRGGGRPLGGALVDVEAVRCEGEGVRLAVDGGVSAVL